MTTNNKLDKVKKCLGHFEIYYIFQNMIHSTGLYGIDVSDLQYM